MKVIITGGGGFLGQILAREILKRGELRSGKSMKAVTELVIGDIVEPSHWLFQHDMRISVVLGDVSEMHYCESLLGDPSEYDIDGLAVFHLGAVMSGTGEADFNLAMKVNLHGTMNMLEATRRWHRMHPDSLLPTFLYTSAGATIGSGHPADWVNKDDTISDSTRSTPHTTYGMTKACGELLLADYHRRFFLDGRGVRLPTVVVRAGAPNAATTSCFSAVVRDTLKGMDVELPIGPDVLHAATGYRAAIDGVLAIHDVSPDKADRILGFDRTVFLPSRPVSLSQLWDATRQVVHPSTIQKLGKVEYKEDDFLSKVVGSFPIKIESSRALALGAPPTPDLVTLVREYCQDFSSDLMQGLKIIPLPKPAPFPSTEPKGGVAANATPAVGAGPKVVALITGGGSGIGRAAAIRLSWGGWGGSDGKGLNSGGYVIVVAGRRRAPLEETARLCQDAASNAGIALETIVLSTDVTKDVEVDSLFREINDRFGRIDLLFNNAGINMPPTSVEEISPNDWRDIVETNLTASWLCARGAMKIMSSQTPVGGRIINNGSISAYTPRPGAAPYTATKHAVLGLTKSIALDGRKINVACGQIDFGNVTSDLTVNMSTGMPQADGSLKPEPTFSVDKAADAVFAMAALPPEANVLSMTIMATKMPFVGRG